MYIHRYSSEQFKKIVDWLVQMRRIIKKLIKKDADNPLLASLEYEFNKLDENF